VRCRELVLLNYSLNSGYFGKFFKDIVVFSLYGLICEKVDAGE